MKKTAIAILLIFVSGISVFAQTGERGNGKISGIVLDAATQQPVEFATIALNDPQTNKPIDGTICDAKGKFDLNKIPNGNYKLVISFIGYETYSQDVAFTDRRNSVDVGSIKLGSSVTELNEVVVEGQRNLVEERVDRTVYNAENDVTTKGGDASDVLRRVPMLSVDLDGNVSMRGNSNIRVLINNKPSTIAASSVADALKQIPADQIKSVEVITSPSAKYDAEGSAGIINIITKKNTLQGATLNFDAGVGLRGSNLGLNGNYRMKKMGFSLGGFGRSNYNTYGSFGNDQLTSTEDENGNMITTRRVQDADTRNQHLFGRYQLGWDYDINKNNFVTASVRYGMRNGNNYQDNQLTQYFDAGNVLYRTELRDSKTVDRSGTVDVNLDYTHTYDKPQRELSVSGQYSLNNRTNDFVNTNYGGDDIVDDRIKNVNDSYNEEVTAQLDYQTPIGTNQMLELGGKQIMRKVSSDYTYFSAAGSDGEFTPNTNGQSSNIFNYDQNVSAGYLSYTFSTKNSYSFKAGARYEYTDINANFENPEVPNPEIPSYGVLVPSFNASKKLKNGNTLKVAYNRRIQRPSIQFLNPNVQASNPLNISFGNPDLKPEYTNNYEISYSTMLKGTSLNFSAFARNTFDAIQSVRRVVNNSDTIQTTYQNIGSENAYGMSVFANVNIGSKFSLNGGTDFYYAVLDNNVPDPNYLAHNEGWVISGRLFGNYNIGKGWGAQFFSFFRGRDVQLQGYRGGFRMYSLGLRKEFNNKKGSVGFGAENFLTPSIKIKSETVSPTITQNSYNKMYNLSFRVNVSYRIGKMSFEGPRRRRSVNNDDLKDGGDNGGGMNDGGMQQGGGFNGGQRQQNRQSAPAVNNNAAPKVPAGDSTAVAVAEGTWAYTVESPQGGSGTIVIKKEGDNYTGTIVNVRFNRENKLTSVKLNGNELTLTYENNFGGNTMAIQIKGIITGDALSGTMTVGQFGNFPLNAKRSQ